MRIRGVSMKLAATRARTVASSRRKGSMRCPGAMVVLAAVAMVTCAVSVADTGVAPAAASVPAVAARVHWGRAEAVPGLAALDKGQNPCVNQAISACASASVTAISCWGAGGCVAGGHFTDRDQHLQAFVARERKGRWGKAEEVPGTAALNKGGNAQVGQLSCARTSVCVAVGTYTGRGGGGQWFTATQRNGRRGSAVPVPVPPLTGAGINAVWCAPGGLCVAGGSFTDSGGARQDWVATQTRGRWRSALEVPGTAALSVGGDASIDAVTCTSAGNCAAAGNFASGTSITSDLLPPLQPFVVTETKGKWGAAQEVPGIQAMTPGLWADTTSIACPSAGNCTAAGNYQDGVPETCQGPVDGCSAVFVVNERHGTWGHVTLVRDVGYVLSLTCPATGDCVAGRYAENGDDFLFGALISETNDHWARPLVMARTFWVNSVSCARAGYCAAGGSFAGCQNLQCSTYGTGRPFVISEWHGTWGKAITPAGLPARYNPNDSPEATVGAVECPPRTTLCVAGGNYTAPANSNNSHAFIVSQAG
jgi:hypothetical protein